MSLENTGPWKHSKEKMNIFLEDAKRGNEAVEKVLGKNKAKEIVINNSSQALAKTNAEILASRTNVGVEQETDIENVKMFLANLPEDTKKILGELRYNTWSGEDFA